VGARVFLDIGGGPVGYRAELENAVQYLGLWDGSAGVGLIAPDPRGPRIEFAEFAGQRPDFTDLAAELAKLYPVIEQIRAVPVHHIIDFGALGCDHLDRNPVAPPDGFGHRERFFRQATGVEREDAERASATRGEIDHNHARFLETSGDRKSIRKCRERPVQDFSRAFFRYTCGV
jgi:hypothetical protein